MVRAGGSGGTVPGLPPTTHVPAYTAGQDQRQHSRQAGGTGKQRRVLPGSHSRHGAHLLLARRLALQPLEHAVQP